MLWLSLAWELARPALPGSDQPARLLPPPGPASSIRRSPTTTAGCTSFTQQDALITTASWVHTASLLSHRDPHGAYDAWDCYPTSRYCPRPRCLALHPHCILCGFVTRASEQPSSHHRPSKQSTNQSTPVTRTPLTPTHLAFARAHPSIPPHDQHNTVSLRPTPTHAISLVLIVKGYNLSTF